MHLLLFKCQTLGLSSGGQVQIQVTTTLTMQSLVGVE